MLGQKVEVLPEAESKQSSEEWMGRTPANTNVIFPKKTSRLGQPVWVKLEEISGSTLRGRIISPN